MLKNTSKSLTENSPPPSLLPSPPSGHKPPSPPAAKYPLAPQPPFQFDYISIYAYTYILIAQLPNSMHESTSQSPRPEILRPHPKALPPLTAHPRRTRPPTIPVPTNPVAKERLCPEPSLRVRLHKYIRIYLYTHNSAVKQNARKHITISAKKHPPGIHSGQIHRQHHSARSPRGFPPNTRHLRSPPPPKSIDPLRPPAAKNPLAPQPPFPLDYISIYAYTYILIAQLPNSMLK